MALDEYERYREFEQQISMPSYESGAYLVTCNEAEVTEGTGYEATTLDILQAHNHLMTAATSMGQTDQARAAVETLIARGAFPGAEAMLEALSAQHHRRP